MNSRDGVSDVDCSIETSHGQALTQRWSRTDDGQVTALAASGCSRTEQDPETRVVEHADGVEIDEHRGTGMVPDRSQQVVVESTDCCKVDVALDRDDDGSADLVEPRVQLHVRPGYGDVASA